MWPTRRAVVGLVVSVAAETVTAQSVSSGRTPPPRGPLLSFVAAARDRHAFAARVHFPLTVHASALAIPLANVADFLRYYDSVVTEGVVDVIGRAHAAARSGRADPRWWVAAGDGSAFGGRTVIIRAVADELRIVQMTVVTRICASLSCVVEAESRCWAACSRQM